MEHAVRISQAVSLWFACLLNRLCPDCILPRWDFAGSFSALLSGSPIGAWCGHPHSHHRVPASTGAKLFVACPSASTTCLGVYSFPRAGCCVNYHQLGGLNQQTCIFSLFLRPDACNQGVGMPCFLEGPGGIPFHTPPSSGGPHSPACSLALVAQGQLCPSLHVVFSMYLSATKSICLP